LGGDTMKTRCRFSIGVMAAGLLALSVTVRAEATIVHVIVSLDGPGERLLVLSEDPTPYPTYRYDALGLYEADGAEEHRSDPDLEVKETYIGSAVCDGRARGTFPNGNTGRNADMSPSIPWSCGTPGKRIEMSCTVKDDPTYTSIDPHEKGSRDDPDAVIDPPFTATDADVVSVGYGAWNGKPPTAVHAFRLSFSRVSRVS